MCRGDKLATAAARCTSIAAEQYPVKYRTALIFSVALIVDCFGTALELQYDAPATPARPIQLHGAARIGLRLAVSTIGDSPSPGPYDTLDQHLRLQTS